MLGRNAMEGVEGWKATFRDAKPLRYVVMDDFLDNDLYSGLLRANRNSATMARRSPAPPIGSWLPRMMTDVGVNIRRHLPHQVRKPMRRM